MCYLAEGKLDLYFTLSINSWDVAAAKFIVEEANGKVTNSNGGKWELDDKEIFGSNKILHRKFIDMVK